MEDSVCHHKNLDMASKQTKSNWQEKTPKKCKRFQMDISITMGRGTRRLLIR